VTIFSFEELFTFSENECKQLDLFVIFTQITAPAEIPVCVVVLPFLVESVSIFSATLRAVDVRRNTAVSKRVTLVPLSANQESS
jgi:hypothetical protein